VVQLGNTDVEGVEFGCVRIQGASLSIRDASVIEGNSGKRSVLMTVALLGRPGLSDTDVYVSYVTVGDSAIAGVDFKVTSGTLRFKPRINLKTITLKVIGDTVVEPDEFFYVALSNAQGATISDGEGVCAILNDDFSFRANRQPGVPDLAAALLLKDLSDKKKKWN
jgi:hypothetical protein